MSNILISINRTMKRGYKYHEVNDIDKSMEIWLETWGFVKECFSENDIDSIYSFDEAYNLTQYLSNWVMDFEEVLQNSRNHELHIEFCKWLIPFYAEDDSNVWTIKMDMAESYFDKGDKETGVILFQKLTTEYPEFAWGWINWSRRYWMYNSTDIDYKMGEDILLKAIKVKNTDDEEYIYSTLIELYEASGQTDKSKDIKRKKEKITSGRGKQNLYTQSGESALKQGDFKENVPYAFGQSDNNTTKIGRNDSCPCGSGKKYKKCCMK